MLFLITAPVEFLHGARYLEQIARTTVFVVTRDNWPTVRARLVAESRGKFPEPDYYVYDVRLLLQRNYVAFQTFPTPSDKIFFSWQLLDPNFPDTVRFNSPVVNALYNLPAFKLAVYKAKDLPEDVPPTQLIDPSLLFPDDFHMDVLPYVCQPKLVPQLPNADLVCRFPPPLEDMEDDTRNREIQETMLRAFELPKPQMLQLQQLQYLIHPDTPRVPRQPSFHAKHNNFEPPFPSTTRIPSQFLYLVHVTDTNPARFSPRSLSPGGSPDDFPGAVFLTLVTRDNFRDLYLFTPPNAPPIFVLIFALDLLKQRNWHINLQDQKGTIGEHTTFFPWQQDEIANQIKVASSVGQTLNEVVFHDPVPLEPFLVRTIQWPGTLPYTLETRRQALQSIPRQEVGLPLSQLNNAPPLYCLPTFSAEMEGYEGNKQEFLLEYPGSSMRWKQATLDTCLANNVYNDPVFRPLAEMVVTREGKDATFLETELLDTIKAINDESVGNRMAKKIMDNRVEFQDYTPYYNYRRMPAGRATKRLIEKTLAKSLDEEGEAEERLEREVDRILAEDRANAKKTKMGGGMEEPTGKRRRVEVEEEDDSSKMMIDGMFETGQPANTMVGAMRTYLDSIPPGVGSLYSDMMLLEEGERKGIVMFNFDRRNRHLIIEQVAVYPRGGNLIENAAREILQDSRVDGVIVSNITSPGLKEKLLSRGWTQLDLAHPDSVIFKLGGGYLGGGFFGMICIRQ
jgi:hypothetical protein